MFTCLCIRLAQAYMRYSKTGIQGECFQILRDCFVITLGQIQYMTDVGADIDRGWIQIPRFPDFRKRLLSSTQRGQIVSMPMTSGYIGRIERERPVEFTLCSQ